MKCNTIKKESLTKLIEPFIYNDLADKTYVVETLDSRSLLTWNRLDLAFKLTYLDNIKVNSRLAKEVYKYDIKAQTLGQFIENGNEENKSSFDDYINIFTETYKNIKNHGFNKDISLIPLSKDGSIMNGAHRVASSIHLNKNISTVLTSGRIKTIDYRYFFERDTPQTCLDEVVQKFIEYSMDNVYIAFLWPSGKGHKSEAESLFSNVVYKKQIKLSTRGAFNLLVELYKHMEWVGSKDNGYKGAKKKLIECFPSFESFKIIVFQAKSLKDVQIVKKEIRDIYKIGFSSIHITDTKEEAIRLSRLLLNENGIHFLNNAEPYKFIDIYNNLDRFKEFLINNKVNCNDIVVDGSLILSIYGLRKNIDVDFLVSDNSKITFVDDEYEIHDSELQYHNKTKSELIYDSDNYFTFYGLKFISFSQLYNMKLKRHEEKDLNDCSIMKFSLEGKSYKKNMSQMKQKIFYLKIKMYRFFVNCLKYTKVYKPIRFIYRKWFKS
ncbi:MAG: hypothetical protein HRT54_05600 [Colwellia sp.]|nr:hypothetical protein [Colwellia sp.]